MASFAACLPARRRWWTTSKPRPNGLGRLRLGIGVTDAGRRNPAVTAQAAATLHLLTGGKAILGIGTGEREGNEPYGVDWSKPVARFEEALATSVRCGTRAASCVSRDPPFSRCTTPYSICRRIKASGPIWVAAHGPRMLPDHWAICRSPWFPVVFQSIVHCRVSGRFGKRLDTKHDPASIIPRKLVFRCPPAAATMRSMRRSPTTS